MKVVYVSIQSLLSDQYRKIAIESGSLNPDDEIHGYNYSDLNDDPLLFHDLILRSRVADFILIRCMSDPCNMNRFPEYADVLETLSSARILVYVGNAEIRESYRHLFNGSDKEYRTICDYLTYKGRDNECSLFIWMRSVFEGREPELRPPVPITNTGLYHEGCLLDDPDRYIKRIAGCTSPRIGIVFDANCWLYDDMSSIDRLI